jgi:hypothetical protein
LLERSTVCSLLCPKKASSSISLMYVVPGCIQLYKRNYSKVAQGCLVHRHNIVVGNVEILHVADQPEIHIKLSMLHVHLYYRYQSA